jgi:hypothetical protein
VTLCEWSVMLCLWSEIWEFKVRDVFVLLYKLSFLNGCLKCTPFICWFMLLLSEKALLQYSQVYGFSPVCVRLWRLSSHLDGNGFLQISHMWTRTGDIPSPTSCPLTSSRSKIKTSGDIKQLYFSHEKQLRQWLVNSHFKVNLILSHSHYIL